MCNLIDGFLDDKMQYNIKFIKNKYKEEIELLYKFNKLSYKIIDGYKGKNVTSENEHIFPAFVHLNKLYQSAVIMLEYGLISSSKIILRSMIEISIQIKYIFLDENNIRKLEKNMIKEALKKIKYIEEKEICNVFQKEYLEKNKKELNLKMEQFNKDEIKSAPNFREMCEMVNCINVYLYYKCLCEPTHGGFSTVRSLNYFSDKGLIINGNEDYSDFKENSLQVIDVLNIVLEEMIKKYEPNLENEYLDLKRIFEEELKSILK